MGREVYSYPDTAPSIVIEYEMSWYPIVSMVIMQKYRVLQQLKFMRDPQVPAARLVSLQQSGRDKKGSFVHDTIVTLEKYLRDPSLVEEALDVRDGKLIRPASDLTAGR